MKTHPLTIRTATRSDASLLSTLLRDLGYPTAAEDIPERLEAFTSRGFGTVLVAELDGTVVAYAALVMYQPLHRQRPVVHLTAFAVRATYQRRGIGQSMIRHIESWAREKDCERIVVTSAEHRDGAHVFYPAVGWRYTGRRYGKILDE